MSPSRRSFGYLRKLSAGSIQTSAIVSVRRALGELDAHGTAPLCIVMNSADWKAIELGRLTTGQFMLGAATSCAPLDAVKRQLFGVPGPVHRRQARPGRRHARGRSPDCAFLSAWILNAPTSSSTGTALTWRPRRN